MGHSPGVVVSEFPSVAACDYHVPVDRDGDATFHVAVQYHYVQYHIILSNRAMLPQCPPFLGRNKVPCPLAWRPRGRPQ
jgi:hypothetical protein